MNYLMLNFQRLGGRLAVAALFSMLLLGSYLYYLQRERFARREALSQALRASRRSALLASVRWLTEGASPKLLGTLEEVRSLPLLDPPSVHVGEASPAKDHPDMRFLRTYGRVKGLPSKEEIQKLSAKELNYIYHSYLDNTDYQCTRKLRMGRVGDGGWEVCDDYQYRPIKPCIVYSFGIKNDFSFDDDIGELYGCRVFSFDPSMNTKSHQRSDRVHFYNVGLSGAEGRLPINTVKRAREGKWRLETLTGIKAMLKHQNATIDVLKMDIEHSEWPAMMDILAKGELSHVRQLLMEYHLYNSGAQDLRERMPILKQIEDLGFRRFYTHLNPMCGPLHNAYAVMRTTCYETYYVNTRFARAAPAE